MSLDKSLSKLIALLEFMNAQPYDQAQVMGVMKALDRLDERLWSLLSDAPRGTGFAIEAIEQAGVALGEDWDHNTRNGLPRAIRSLKGLASQLQRLLTVGRFLGGANQRPATRKSARSTRAKPQAVH